MIFWTLPCLWAQERSLHGVQPFTIYGTRRQVEQAMTAPPSCPQEFREEQRCRCKPIKLRVELWAAKR